MNSLVSVLFCIVSAVVVVVVAQPSPPNINQQFQTNFTLSGSAFIGNSTVLFNGFLAIDYINGGLKFIFGGEEYVPISLHTAVTASPNQQTQEITGYMWEAPLCWNLGQVPKDFLILFPLQIPADATFLGNTTSNSESIGMWQFTESYSGYTTQVEMWVAWDNTAIVKVLFEQLPYLQTLEWDFFATIVGPFSSKVYAPPKMKCTAGPVAAAKYMSPRNLLEASLKMVLPLLN